jgi:phage RecT family recombinase
MSTATEAPQQNGQLAKIDADLGPRDILPLRELRSVLAAKLPNLERLYPPHMRAAAARLSRAIVIEVERDAQKDPKEQSLCRSSSRSLVACLFQAATLNLEIGGVLGQSYLVPYFNKELGVYEAAYQLGYRGMLTLAFRSGRVGGCTAQLAYKGDHFEVQYGTAMGIGHRPGAARGEPTHAYAVVTYKGGGLDFEVMTVPEVDEHRKKFSRQGTSRDGGRAGVWAKNFNAMALKTVLRKLLKRAPVGIDPGLLDEPEEAVAGEIAAPAEAPAPRQVAAARPVDLDRLMVVKGVSPADAASWLNREFEADHDELPPVDALSPAERQALAEYLAGLPDARAVGS